MYNVIGLMSGTSMDGLDIAYCSIYNSKGQWHYSLIHTQTVPYTDYWKTALNKAYSLTDIDLDALDIHYGIYISVQVSAFIDTYSITSVDFISSHGHTVHHQPHLGITVQIGNGKEIAKRLRIPVINDFRTQDVSLGGQGAPLVPIGDQLLFTQYQGCLNLGGFSNISYVKGMERIAFDIGPVNIILNAVAQRMGFEYDRNGELARRGELNIDLYNRLNSLDYYAHSTPKSLGREWVEVHISPLIDSITDNASLLRTLVEHCAFQIASVLNKDKIDRVLVTGGGVFNIFFMTHLQFLTSCALIIPESRLVEYKEALIFAFMGVLRYKGEINTLQSVTGASIDHSAGVIHPVSTFRER